MDPLSITAVGWLMSSLVKKAVTALLEAWAKRKGLENEFKTLKDQLLQLGALLTSARGDHTNNSSLKELVEELQQLAYGAENLLDELDYYRLQDQILNQILQDAFSSSDIWFLSPRNHFERVMMSFDYILDAQVHSRTTDLSQRMKKLAEKLQESVEEVRKAVGTESNVMTTQNTKRSQTEATKLLQTSSFLTESSVFQRDQNRDELLNLLENEETTIVGKVFVLAIVGCGGVGKTTLAGLVFNDPKVQSCFDVRSWICVSTRFDIVRLAREMLESVCGNRYGELCNLNELQNKLMDKLESKRFLLVLDDIWEGEDIKSQWNSMVTLLNNCMMRRAIILVTTRNHSVVEMVNARKIINLHRLDDNALLSFFSTCIFDDPNYGGYWRLRNIGEQIAVKLKGNPLATKSVSALLKENLDERYWIEIRDSEVWKIQSGPNDIMPALRLIYEHMPFHLQRCFSYCAMFPEDRPFSFEELVYLWMAQGFLDVRSEGKRMEDIGSDYFNDLLNHGFFQSKPSAYGSLVCYTFHDHLLYRFARMVSLKECLTISSTESRRIPPTIRHLAIFDSTARGEKELDSALPCLKGENLSTLINWDELPSGNLRNISNLLKETKFLRAMRLPLQQLHYCNFQNFASLRYLKLIMSNMNTCETLPGEICRLYHLEVFVIEGGMFLDELPNRFNDLVSLRHFIVEGYLHSKICGVGKLTSLQELNHFDVQQKIGFEIEQLSSLKEIRGSLQIRNLENVKSKGKASKARLVEKEKLDALYLHWNHGEQENESVLEGLRPNTNLKSLTIDGYCGVASPTWLDPSLIFLESLTLINCTAWEQLPPIGELEFLRDLKLSRLPLREIGSQFYGVRHSMKFPSLEELWIADMEDLIIWEWNDQLQLFPCLKKLSVLHCIKLVNLPLLGSPTYEILERFPSLEILIIEDCPLIFELPPLPYSSPFSYISIERSGSSSLKMGKSLVFHSPLHSLEISYISSVQSLDLHYFVALKNLVITRCESLTSLTFGERLVCLKTLSIISCQTLSSLEGLKSWVNLEKLDIRECSGFIAAWDSASKELERTEPDFSLSLTRIEVDSLTLLTLPICKQLTSLQIFELRFYAFTEEHEISPQFLTSIDLVDIKDCKNLQSFPLDLFPSLKKLRIMFPHIKSLPTNSHTKITEKCLKVRNIKEINIRESPVKIEFVLS
ncbi:putative disease resistance protein RGA3 [Carex rostrata]